MVQGKGKMSTTATAEPEKNSAALSEARQKNEQFYKFLGTGAVPEWVIRLGIRNMLGQKLRSEHRGSAECALEARLRFVEDLKTRPIAIHTSDANSQHYEVPTEFFKMVLGPNMKYSSCYWSDDTKSLADAETAMLALTCKRADIQPGQRILDLGCGWGAFALYAARTYPNCEITALSNSRTQRQYIEATAASRSLKNLRVITDNIETFDTQQRFDRIVSVEMFEHMKNYQALLARISTWLEPEGKLFVHIFTHRDYEYHYEDGDGSDWLTRNFFAGGTMPSDSLLLYFQDHLKIIDHWRINGMHYGKTAEEWLNNMSSHKQEIMPILESTYGKANGKCWWIYWRLFFLSCAELWGFSKGEEWMVSHYLFQKPRA